MAALVVASAFLVGVGALMAAQLCHHLAADVGLDAARRVAVPVTTGGSVAAIGVGAAGAVLLAMTGRLRWAVVYLLWVAAGTAAVIAAVLAALGANAREVASQVVTVPLPTVMLAAFVYGVVLLVREAMVRPVVWMFDFLAELLTAIAGIGRWGKALAVLAALWIVVGSALMLRGVL